MSMKLNQNGAECLRDFYTEKKAFFENERVKLDSYIDTDDYKNNEAFKNEIDDLYNDVMNKITHCKFKINEMEGYLKE
ncbi:hypothetical protein [Mangrovibacter plantisponsor]|uniref:Uncharacterized protein n=1 Tax=Mangrovibacter plantisponsor TaxID=451513 RepID=A0A317PZ43_9ENTR|nr:hypothetical protein [Mangrovibacter plantisponsor]PWW04971.1 hypothetical protein DES37_11467 [Mangrovibacter plantisponsor]